MSSIQKSPLDIPNWYYQVNADQSFIQQRKRFISIPTFFHKWKWWGRIFTRITWRSSNDHMTHQFIDDYVFNPNLLSQLVQLEFRIRSGIVSSRYDSRFPFTILSWKCGDNSSSRIRARPSKISPNCVGTLNGFTHVDSKTELIFGASFDF